MHKWFVLLTTTLPVTIAAVTALATSAALAGDQIPFRGSDLGGFAIVGTCPGTDPIVLTDDWGSGEGTHLGRYSFRASECVNLASFAVTNGSFTITAANGDTVRGSYAGQAAAVQGSPCDITYDVQGPVTGGTGRFQGATGHLRWKGFANLCAGTLGDEISGTISSVGSNN